MAQPETVAQILANIEWNGVIHSAEIEYASFFKLDKREPRFNRDNVEFRDTVSLSEEQVQAATEGLNEAEKNQLLYGFTSDEEEG